MGFFKRLRQDERGNALIIMGAAMPLVIGFAGLANDTVQWSLWKRQLQRQADSAALAGVYARFAGQNLNTMVNTDLAKNSRTGIAFATGYPVITALGDTADYNNTVQVTLAVRQQLPFSSFFMSEAPLIIVNATAAAKETGEYCAQAQIDTASTGISAGGTVEVSLKCGMITNSTSMDAAVAFGDSSVDASPVAAVGGLDGTDNWAAGTKLLPFTLPQADPFSDIAPPPIPSGCSNFSVNPSESTTLSPTHADGTPRCINNLTVKGDLTLNPGTYVITGDVQFNSGANVNCDGCTFILTDDPALNTGTVDINGGAKLNLKAPDTGTYKGILFYQDRGADPTKVNRINGHADSIFKGAFYFPHSQVQYAGTAGITYECVKLVSWQLTFTGTASLTNNCPTDWYGDRFKGRHVRLVG